MEDARETEQGETYLRLLGQVERSLSAYVHSLVLRTADAEDILQECKIVMWKQFSRFEPETNFLAWARKIALHLILNYRRAEKRRSASALNEEFVECVAGELEHHSDHFARRAEALQSCLRKLPAAHRRVVVWRYFEDCDVEEIAARSERTEGATYRLLSRIRKVLNDCVTRTLTLQSG